MGLLRSLTFLVVFRLRIAIWMTALTSWTLYFSSVYLISFPRLFTIREYEVLPGHPQVADCTYKSLFLQMCLNFPLIIFLLFFRVRGRYSWVSVFFDAPFIHFCGNWQWNRIFCDLFLTFHLLESTCLHSL